MEKYKESLTRSEKHLSTADHLTHITFPLVKEKRLLLKILEEITNSLIFMINSILQLEYIMKAIQITPSSKDNFQLFKRVSSKYSISAEDISKITEIISLAEKHKKSHLEFVKGEKVVIISEGMSAEILTIEKIKLFLLFSKNLLKKSGAIIKERKDL